jgi:hypothetical protein
MVMATTHRHVSDEAEKHQSRKPRLSKSLVRRIMAWSTRRTRILGSMRDTKTAPSASIASCRTYLFRRFAARVCARATITLVLHVFDSLANSMNNRRLLKTDCACRRQLQRLRPTTRIPTTLSVKWRFCGTARTGRPARNAPLF